MTLLLLKRASPGAGVPVGGAATIPDKLITVLAPSLDFSRHLNHESAGAARTYKSGVDSLVLTRRRLLIAGGVAILTACAPAAPTPIPTAKPGAIGSAPTKDEWTPVIPSSDL